MLLICAVAVEKSTEIVLKTVDCGSPLGDFSDLDIDCDEGSTVELCKLSKGKTYKGTLKVTPNTIINNATIVLHALIGSAELPFPIPDKDLCNNHDVVCPLKPKEEVEVSISIAIPSIAPSTGLKAKMEFQSGGGDLVCLEFLGSIGSGLDQSLQH